MTEQEPPQKDAESNSRKIEPTVIVALITAIGAVTVGIITSVVPVVTRQSPSLSPSIPVSSSSNEQKYDLTGIWQTNDLGPSTFYVRQIGSTVWWYGQGPDWSHVLTGTLSGDKIQSAGWANVPSPQNRKGDHGTTTVIVESSRRMHAIDDSGVSYTLERR